MRSVPFRISTLPVKPVLTPRSERVEVALFCTILPTVDCKAPANETKFVPEPLFVSVGLPVPDTVPLMARFEELLLVHDWLLFSMMGVLIV